MIPVSPATPKGPPAPPASEAPELSYISPSSIKSYLTCSLKYCFEKVLRLPRPASANLHIGKAVHEGVRRFHLSVWRGENLSHDQVVDSYCASFALLEKEEEVEFKDDGHRSECLATGGRVLRAYLESEAAALTERPAGVEVRLEEQIEGFPAPLHGIIDLVRFGNIPVDFKTVASTPSDLELESFQHEIQMTTYALMLEDATGVEVPSMELIFLVKTKTPKVIRHVLPPPTGGQVQRLKALAEIFTEGVRNRRFHPQPGQHCGWCPYRQECREWKGGAP
jgi:putative RecB family exonuclease